MSKPAGTERASRPNLATLAVANLEDVRQLRVEQGLGQNAIASRLGISSRVVARALDELGLPRTLPADVLLARERLAALPDEVHEARARKAAELKRQGKPYREIAAELGCSTNDVGRYLDAARVGRNPRNGDVPQGKVSVNAIRRRAGGQHENTIKKTLTDHGVQIERLELFDGRTLLLVDENALAPLLCSHEGCAKLATVEKTGTCKRHSRVAITCKRPGCGRTRRRSPSKATQSRDGFTFCSITCWGKWRAKYAIGTLRVLPKEVRERLGSTHAKAIAKERDKKIGAPFTKVDAGKAERILKLEAERRPDGRRRHSERAIARIVDLSKTAVHNVIVNRQGVIDHFSLHDLV